jgi:diaminopimelate epimerase
MDLRFYKLRVCDADLILVDDLGGNGRDRDWEKAARALLHRRRGAGADRLAVLSRAEADTWLRVFGPAGEGGPYADAALCAARYLLDSGRSGSESVALRVSGGGTAEVDVLDSASLGLSLGPPRGVSAGGEGGAGGGEEEPLSPEKAGGLAALIESGGARYQVLPLRVGLPGSDGLAVFVEGASPRAKVAASGGTSAVVVRVASRTELLAQAQRGFALDASAAAALALAASAALGRSEREAMVRLGEGALWIEWTARGSLYAVGRPEYAYRGEFYLNEAAGNPA